MCTYTFCFCCTQSFLKDHSLIFRCELNYFFFPTLLLLLFVVLQLFNNTEFFLIFFLILFKLCIECQSKDKLERDKNNNNKHLRKQKKRKNVDFVIESMNNICFMKILYKKKRKQALRISKFYRFLNRNIINYCALNS